MPESSLRQASQVYALSQGRKCEGGDQCHYCGSPCGKLHTHNEPIAPALGRPVGPGTRARPGSPFVCDGCWLWRGGKITAPFLSGGYKDGAKRGGFDWLFTPGNAWAIGPFCNLKLYSTLTKPPLKFALMLSSSKCGGTSLQCCPANDNRAVAADTPLKFSLDDVAFTYTIYDLEQAAAGNGKGYDPGTRALLDYLGPIPREMVQVAVTPVREQQQGAGRPKPPPPDPRIDEQSRVVKGSRRSG